MVQTVLTSTQTTGDPFTVDAAGLHDCLVTSFQSGSIRLEVEQGGAYHAMDTRGSDTATWTSSGGGVVFLNPLRKYRAVATTAGATMTVVFSDRYAAPHGG